MKKLSIRPMEFYCDRGENSGAVKVAEDILRNKIKLWGEYYFEPTTENIFDTVFETTDQTYRMYLFAMDYLSTLLSAYRQTNDQRYRDKFLEIVRQFFAFYDRGALVLAKEDDLIPCAQTLMFIKSFTLIDYGASLREKIIGLLYEHALYCFDDQNHYDNNNHGLFTDMALLHLSVLFDALPEAAAWQRHAVERVRRLYAVAFYEDGFNNEGSLTYFLLNLLQYQKILSFCAAYKIAGLELVQKGLNRSRAVAGSFAHRDNSFPVIGDGRENFTSGFQHDSISALYPDGGICVLKTGDIYLTFKCKSTLQSHTHVDDSSITIRYRDIDLALDCGQYNYDRYHPINRFLRSSAGHSGIVPLFVDGLFLKEYLDRRNAAGIQDYRFDGTVGTVSGGYELDDGAIKVWRSVTVEPYRVEVRDRWECASPQTMRQRFALPKEFLPKSKFTASKRLFETAVGTCGICYQILSESPVFTTTNFGVLSRLYEEFEPAILLDTVAEHSMGGEITAVITIQDKGAHGNG